MFRIFALLIILHSFLFNVSAQDNVIMYPDLHYRVENQFLKSLDYHSFFSTHAIPQEKVEYFIDSIYGVNDKSLFYVGNDKRSFNINPVLQSNFIADTSFLQHYAVGFSGKATFSSKIKLDVNYSFHVLSQPSLSTRIDTAGLVYHWGASTKFGNSFRFFHSLNGKITFSPLKFLSFSLGKDKHFWGDGYRSLFISDNAPSYPFFATTLKFWRIQYTSMNTFMHDYTINNYEKPRTKYTAMHALSWNVNRRLNVNIFETVIWYKRNDSISGRSFDLNYLNPFIFYRPLEYNLGSPDNVLMGVGFKYLVANSGSIYGQFLLDEFHLKEIKNGKKWWGNKNAFQVGMKWYGIPGFSKIYVQLEYSQARPFTYAHSYTLQNYGSMLHPLAHPLGTNFREGLIILRYDKGRWFFNYIASFARYGIEPDGKTVGADIYRSSMIRARDFGNYIGQGMTINELIQGVKFSRVLQARWGLVGEVGIRDVIEFLPERKHRISIDFGIKTLLYRDERLH